MWIRGYRRGNTLPQFGSRLRPPSKSHEIMHITDDRLRQTFSEGGAQEIYQEVKASGDFLGFSRQYAFSQDYRVARSALWGLTKASKEELKQLQVILNEVIDQAMQTDNSSVRRLSLNIVERLEMNKEDLLKRTLEAMEIDYYKPAVKCVRKRILNGKL